MTKYDHLTELFGLANVHVTHYQLVGPNRLNLFIESTVAAGVCPTCLQISLAVHEYAEPQLLRDLPIWNRRCWLRYCPRRFECATCGKTFVERVAWREPGLDYTTRYEQFIYEQVRRQSVAQVARDERLSEDMVHVKKIRFSARLDGLAGILINHAPHLLPSLFHTQLSHSQWIFGNCSRLS